MISNLKFCKNLINFREFLKNEKNKPEKFSKLSQFFSQLNENNCFKLLLFLVFRSVVFSPFFLEQIK